MNDEEARWLERRLHERELQHINIGEAVRAAMSTGDRFTVEIRFPEKQIQTFNQPRDETFIVPSGPEKK